jgi:aryl-alcohol dehydrogenase-like predicted oxidoreductase
MDYRNLGNSGLKVAPICLGTMMFGDRTDEAEAGRIVASAREAGVNFIDTADVYTKGESEKITGRLLRNDRAYWVLATKVANPMPGADGRDDPNRRGTSRKWIMQAIDESLARLGTDYVDLYYLHRDVESTPLEETVRAMDDLVRAGKVRHWGLSNFRGWRIAEAMSVARQLGAAAPVACQPYYNLMNRQPENDILPACAYHGIGVVPYSPLARGVLTGKYKPGDKPAEGTRAGRGDKRILETEFRAESLAIAQQLGAHAANKGSNGGHFAVQWVLNNPIITSVIAGPRTLEQWNDYLAALRSKFDAEDERLVDSLVSPGHPSTPGYNDPAYPLTGRPVKR